MCRTEQKTGLNGTITSNMSNSNCMFCHICGIHAGKIDHSIELQEQNNDSDNSIVETDIIFSKNEFTVHYLLIDHFLHNYISSALTVFHSENI